MSEKPIEAHYPNNGCFPKKFLEADSLGYYFVEFKKVWKQ